MVTTMMAFLKCKISKHFTTLKKHPCCAGSSGMNSAPTGSVTIPEPLTPMPQPADPSAHIPLPSLCPSGRPQTRQPMLVAEKECLPVPWMGLWGAKPGDAFHLLGDHILGEVIMPGQSCGGTGQGKFGSGWPEGPVTGISGDQSCTPFPAVCCVWQSRGALGRGVSGEPVVDLSCPSPTLRNRFWSQTAQEDWV